MCSESIHSGKPANTIKHHGSSDTTATFDDARTDLQNKRLDILDKVAVVAKSAPIPNDPIAMSQ